MFPIAWNVGTCLVMIWIPVECLIQFVNSVVWNGNTTNHAPLWCDICRFPFSLYSEKLTSLAVATHIMLGANVAISAGSLCIYRRLYYISRLNTVRITHSEVRCTCASCWATTPDCSPEMQSDNYRHSYRTWAPDSLRSTRYVLFRTTFNHTKDSYSIHYSRSSI